MGDGRKKDDWLRGSGRRCYRWVAKTSIETALHSNVSRNNLICFTDLSLVVRITFLRAYAMDYHNSILQYRPPIDAICVELPAGLIDGDETAGSSGVRELEEETGYAGEVVYTGQVVYSDPGMSKANMRLVTIECDLKEGEAPPVANLEDGEFIEVRVTPLARTFHSFIVGRMFTD